MAVASPCFTKRLEFLQIGNESVQRPAEIFAVGQGDVAPHFRRAGRNARGVTKTGGAQRGLMFGLHRVQNQIRQRRRNDVRQMAGTADEQIVLRRRPVAAPAHPATSKTVPVCGRRPRLDFFVGVTMQTAFANKSARAAQHARFFPPAIGWLPTKCAPDLSTSDSSSRTTPAFTLPTSVTIAPRFSAGRNCCAQRTHLRQRRAKDDEVGVGNGGEQIGRGKIHRARFFAIFQAGRAPDKAGDSTREFPASDGQPDGAAEQADADDGNFPKLHGGRRDRRNGMMF